MSVCFWNQSAYSLLQSTLRIDELVTCAKEDNQWALGLCDTNVLSGAVQFYQACIKNQIKPLIGMSIVQLEREYLVFARNQNGYQSLVQMTTAIKLEQIEPEIALQQYAQDVVIIIPQSHPQLQAAIVQRDLSLATSLFAQYQKSTTTVYFGAVATTAMLQAQFSIWQQFCAQTKITPLAIHQAQTQTANSIPALRVLNALASGKKQPLAELLSQPEQGDVTQWTQQQLALAFQQWPQAVATTEQVAQECTVEFDLTARYLPAYDLPTGVENAGAYLQALCLAGLKKRYRTIQAEHYHRLQYELQVIDSMGFNDYFLIVWDFIKYARNQGIAIGPGRGSAVGSLVSYCLGITNCDPLAYGLLFERFLNPERVSLPDIDIDIEDDRRQEVIDYVRLKYGADRVVQIATFGTFATKAAFREVARILDASPAQLATISKILPATVQNLAQAYQTIPALQKLLAEDRFLARVFQIARQIEGLPRNVSTHAAGIIIGAQSLQGVIPLQEGMGATAATQFTMNELEALGMLKMDFLGLRNLSLMTRIVKRITNVTQRPFDLQQIPLDDQNVYRMLQQAQTTGVFQLESGGMRAALRQIQPSQFEDIVATLALFRPGPMENIPVYSRRKSGQEAISYPDQSLAKILEPTYGIIIYQEQIMQIATQLAGYSLGEADILRRAISKKNEAILAAERENFIAHCVKKNVNLQTAHTIYDLIVKFANYGFNKSHAVAYGLLAYQIAYLKVHYPTFFWCELLNSVIQSDGKIHEYLQAAKQQNIQIMKPSIKTGTAHFQVVNQGLQMGLLTIKNVGLAAVQAIDELRAQKPFGDFKTTILRLKQHRALTKATLMALIDAGAFDEFEWNHATMINELENVQTQGDLLSFIGGDKYESPIQEQAEFSTQQLMEREVAVYGYYLFTHPVMKYRSSYPQLQTTAQLATRIGMNVTLLGYCEKVRSIKTKRGELMQFLSVSDEFGSSEAVAFPKVFAKYATELQVGNLVLLKGKIELRQEQPQIIIYELEKLLK
ncbi:MAG: DNA polymerase III subunit alpha [Culicoidibacterales bacterium]